MVSELQVCSELLEKKFKSGGGRVSFMLEYLLPSPQFHLTGLGKIDSIMRLCWDSKTDACLFEKLILILADVSGVGAAG